MWGTGQAHLAHSPITRTLELSTLFCRIEVQTSEGEYRMPGLEDYRSMEQRWEQKGWIHSQCSLPLHPSIIQNQPQTSLSARSLQDKSQTKLKPLSVLHWLPNKAPEKHMKYVFLTHQYYANFADSYIANAHAYTHMHSCVYSLCFMFLFV